MNLLECLLYGLISGFSEFLPISSQAHQALLLKIFGFTQHNYVQDFMIHIAVLSSIIFSNRSLLERIRREKKLSTHSRARHNRRVEYRGLLDLRIVKTAAVPMVIGLLFTSIARPLQYSLPILSLMLIINGIILYIPQQMLQGNKDSTVMSKLDSILMGIGGAFSVFPGISRVGATTSVAIARGADRQHAFNWSILLSIPALLVLCAFDFFALFGNTGSFTVGFFGHLFSVIGAFTGSYLSIILIRFLTVRIGFSGFAYYSWGAALFSFILYLTVV